MRTFSKSSAARLAGVHPVLVSITSLALARLEHMHRTFPETPQVRSYWPDFAVISGRRTAAEQAELVKAGRSQTMESAHLRGLAVDLQPYRDGKPSQELEDFYPLAWAMAEEARQRDKLPATTAPRLQWGGSWTEITGPVHFLSDANYEVRQYRQRCEKEQREPFIDAGHFALILES